MSLLPSQMILHETDFDSIMRLARSAPRPARCVPRWRTFYFMWHYYLDVRDISDPQMEMTAEEESIVADEMETLGHWDIFFLKGAMFDLFLHKGFPEVPKVIFDCIEGYSTSLWELDYQQIMEHRFNMNMVVFQLWEHRVMGASDRSLSPSLPEWQGYELNNVEEEESDIDALLHQII